VKVAFSSDFFSQVPFKGRGTEGFDTCNFVLELWRLGSFSLAGAGIS
jgi:hypothetical protein